MLNGKGWPFLKWINLPTEAQNLIACAKWAAILYQHRKHWLEYFLREKYGMYYIWALNRAPSCRGGREVVESLGCRPIRRKWNHWGHILKGHWHPIPISIPVLLFSFQATPRWRALLYHAPHFVTFFPAAGSKATKSSNCGLRLWKSESNKTFLSLSWLSQAFYQCQKDN